MLTVMQYNDASTKKCETAFVKICKFSSFCCYLKTQLNLESSHIHTP